MQSIRGIILAVGMAFSPHLLQAQTAVPGTFNDVVGLVQSAQGDSIVSIVAESQGLAQVFPSDLPASGTYWWVMPGGTAVPAPCLPQNVNASIYQIAAGQFLVDETGGQVLANPPQFGAQAMRSEVASVATAQADALVNLIAQVQTAAANQQLQTMARTMGMDVSTSDDDDASSNVAYTFDINQLWLEITNVANGQAYFNLHNATNQVYAIWSTTNLLTPFQVETELWPTPDQTNVLSFTLPTLAQWNLFVRAEDWTGVDSDGDGIPDWWAWKYFGTINVTDTNLDNYFRPLLYDYQNGINPNNMGFSQVLAWGDNSFGQCNVPLNLTNATAVAGNGDAYLVITLEYTFVDGILTLWPFVSDTPTGAFSLALKADGGMVAWGDYSYGQTNIPSNLTNIMAISAGSCHGLALDLNRNVHAWGSWDSANEYGISVVTNSAVVPSGISNVVAIAAGRNHDVVLCADGTVLSWGYYTNAPWVVVPANLPPAKDVAAGWSYSAALLTNGTVAVWAGSNSAPTSSIAWFVPASLTNAVAISGGPFDLLVLKADGYIIDLPGDSEIDLVQITNAVSMANGYMPGLALDGSGTAWILINSISSPNYPLSNIIAIAAGWNHALAIRGGLLTPLIVGQPASQTVALGTNLTLSVQALSCINASYQWQFNDVNLPGATNAVLTLANVQSSDAGNYGCVVANNFGEAVSSNALVAIVTVPVITYQSQPTNVVCIYGNYVGFSAMASAPGQTNGFPVSYHWQLNGTNISGAITTNYSFTVNDTNGGTYTFIASNAAGSTSASWQVMVTNTINVTNDLLLIYNSNSSDSSNLCAYYLAHRPMVSGANVLGVACDDVGEFTTSTNCNSQIVFPVLNWLTNNPSKLPQYVILFYDIPTRLMDLSRPAYVVYGSVGYHLHNLRPDWQPFVNYINASNLVDCEAYVDKLAAFGSNYSPGQLVISASAGVGYANTNFVLDNVRHGAGTGDSDYTGYGDVVSYAIPAITNANPSAGITYIDGVETSNVLFLPHITNALNVAGYICWGGHSNWGTNINDGNFPLDGNAQWTGNSGWWIIKTLESYNGRRDTGSVQSNFIKWFSPNAFGGTNYSNTPVGACSNVEEPGLEGSTTISAYFSLWASGKNFGVCAWNARNTTYFQPVGDPFVTR